ncbi:MAG: HAD family phosphatase [Erysipelotrichaceae bacterium]|nr:HAD family phosphatase [Erysipelotrichaceae bacterium]
MIKAIIFDMDGLMIDSERATYNSYLKVLKPMGLTMSEDHYKTFLGKNVAGIQERIRAGLGEDFDAAGLMMRMHIVLNQDFEENGVPIKPGLIELLQYLKDNNYKTIVATSSDRDRVDRILAQADITDYFNDSVCGNEVARGKPNPDIFLTACDKLGVQPDEAIVLEDSESGIMAGYNANIKVICVPDMKYPEPEYAEKTWKFVKTLDEIIDVLKEENQ